MTLMTLAMLAAQLSAILRTSFRFLDLCFIVNYSVIDSVEMMLMLWHFPDLLQNNYVHIRSPWMPH